MAPPIKIRLASRAYDGTLPILRGQKSIPGFEFDVTETEDVPGMFAGMFKGQYDVSEMSLGELIYYTSRSKAEFVAVPADCAVVLPDDVLMALLGEFFREVNHEFRKAEVD